MLLMIGCDMSNLSSQDYCESARWVALSLLLRRRSDGLEAILYMDAITADAIAKHRIEKRWVDLRGENRDIEIYSLDRKLACRPTKTDVLKSRSEPRQGRLSGKRRR